MSPIALRRFSFSLLVGLIAAAPAWAEDDEEEDDLREERRVEADEFNLDDFEDDGGEVEQIKRMDDADQVEPGDQGDEDLDDEDFIDNPEAQEGQLRFDDELDELDEDEVGGEGVDNVGVYRNYQATMNDLGPEEELISWENYLKKYPNTLFKDRIERRMEELEAEIYGERISGPTDGYKDAKDREIYLSHPMLLESIDPRTRIRIGASMGFPEYVAGVADFEYQLMRPLSVHAGLITRYTGPNLEFGAKYALVKSARLNLLVTGIFDVHYNMQPGYVGFRPIVGVGKRFNVGEGLDVQGQLGADFEAPVRGREAGIRYMAGANVFFHLSDIVGMFAESSTQLKHIGWSEAGTFSYSVVSFGLRFSPTSTEKYEGSRYRDMVHATLNADVPYQYRYWGYNLGDVRADGLIYLDGLGVKGFEY